VKEIPQPPQILPPEPTLPEPPAPKPPTPPPTPRVGPPHDLWFSAQYLGYILRPAPLRDPLLTEDGSNTLIGAGEARFGWIGGLGLSGGAWFDEEHKFAFELAGFLTGRQTASSEVSAGQGQTLTRPVVDTLTGAPARFFVSAPGFLTGSFRADSSARLGGMTTRLAVNRVHTRELTLDVFAGVRYLDLDESLLLTQTTQAVGAGIVLLNGVTYGPGVPLTIADRFHTRNQFWGGEIGAKAEYRHGPWTVAATPSIGFGSVHQTVGADGSSSVPGVSLPGGLYAVTGGNAGANVTNRFTMMTELRGELGLYLTASSRVSVGYDMLYLGSVARPGDQIDYVVNTRLVPATRRFGSLSGVASPLPTAARTDFLAHGLRVAFELRY
jgi:hypothetical protein